MFLTTSSDSIAEPTTETPQLSGLVGAACVGPGDRVTIEAVELQCTRPEWDEFVRNHGGDIVQTTMWSMSKLASGVTAILIEARDPAGALAGGALMIVRGLPFGIKLGYVARGPVVPTGREQLTTALLEALRDVSQQKRFVGLAIQPMLDSSATERFFARHEFFGSPVALGPEATVALDLTKSEDDLLAAMSASRRRNIRKSQQQNVEIIASDDVALFHRLHAASAERQGFRPLSLEYLQQQWDALAPHEAVTILVAKISRRPVAAIWLSEFGDSTVYRLPGWDASAAKSARVNEALHWHAVKRTQARGAKFYDFGGLDPSIAKLVLAGRSLPAGFEKTPGHFKLCFNRMPTLLPSTRMGLRNGLLNRLARTLAPSLREKSMIATIARKLRAA